MCVYIYIHINIDIHLNININIYIYIYICMYVYVCIYIYRVHTFTEPHKPLWGPKRDPNLEKYPHLPLSRSSGRLDPLHRAREPGDRRLCFGRGPSSLALTSYFRRVE